MTPLEVISLYPAHNHTLQSLFETRRQANPTKSFIVFKDKTWTWGEFADAIERTARVLAGRGVKKGDRVAIMATNTYAHVMLMFALARIRAIMVPVNPEFGVTEANYVMSHAGVSAVACSTDTLQIAKQAAAELQPAPWFMMVDEAAEGLPLLTELIKNPGDAKLPDDAAADDTFAIIYSSGTTGFPKGVMHAQKNFVLSGERHVARVETQADDRVLCILPMFHINALFYSVASAVTAGATLIIVPRFSASTFWRTATDSGGNPGQRHHGGLHHPRPPLA